MKKFIRFSIACIVPGLMLIACQHDESVFAGNAENVYQPRLSPAGKFYKKITVDEVQGELIRVDVPMKTIAVRMENGIVQTFRFNENTMVVGLDDNSVSNLEGKEGSEMTVRWSDKAEPKMATNVGVTQIIIAKPSRRSRRH
jgi:hypothetical protein